MKSPIASLADSLNPCRCYATRESEKNAHCVGIFKYGRAIYFNGRFNSRWRQIFGHIQAHLLQFKVQYKHQLRNVAFPFVFVQSNNTFKIFTFYLHYLRFSEPAKKWDLEKLAFTHIPLSFRVMSMKINVKPLMNSLKKQVQTLSSPCFNERERRSIGGKRVEQANDTSLLPNPLRKSVFVEVFRPKNIGSRG